MDQRCAPERVFLAYPPDEITQTAIDLGPPYPIPRFPSPEGLKASPMPPSTVSGSTTRTAPSRLGPSRTIHTNKPRSLPHMRSRAGARRNAMPS